MDNERVYNGFLLDRFAEMYLILKLIISSENMYLFKYNPITIYLKDK